jgi:hypothetical protein
MAMGDLGVGDEELPLYAEVEVDDGSTGSPDTAALVLGVSAGGLAVVGDLLIPSRAGQAFVCMAVAVVLVAVARIVNRGRSPEPAQESDDVVIDLRTVDAATDRDDRQEATVNRAR